MDGTKRQQDWTLRAQTSNAAAESLLGVHHLTGWLGNERNVYKKIIIYKSMDMGLLQGTGVEPPFPFAFSGLEHAALSSLALPIPRTV